MNRVYKTGWAGRMHGKDVDSIPAIMRFYTQELGAELPKSYKARGVLSRRIKEEMEIQSWDFQDLVAAIRFMKQQGERPKGFGAVFYKVSEARNQGLKTDADDDLNEKIGEALAEETDPTWIRRLTMAKGKARVAVYMEWKRHLVTRNSG